VQSVPITTKIVSSIIVLGEFYPGTPLSSTNKTDRQDITAILLKVALNTINQTKPLLLLLFCIEE
jgi:hypothetical protein